MISIKFCPTLGDFPGAEICRQSVDELAIEMLRREERVACLQALEPHTKTVLYKAKVATAFQSACHGLRSGLIFLVDGVSLDGRRFTKEFLVPFAFIPDKRIPSYSLMYN